MTICERPGSKGVIYCKYLSYGPGDQYECTSYFDGLKKMIDQSKLQLPHCSGYPGFLPNVDDELSAGR